MARLLIVARRDLPADESGSMPQPLVHQLGLISRRGVRLLVLATQPDDWLPSQGALDGALSAQQQLYQQLESAGIHLDGVVYVADDRSGRGQSINRSLQDVRGRYGSVESIILLSSDSEAIAGIDEALASAVLLEMTGNADPGPALTRAFENIILQLDEESEG